MRAIIKSRGMLAGLAFLAIVGVSACSAHPTPAAAGPSEGQATSPAATAAAGATTTPPAAAASTPASSPSLVAMQTPAGGEFASPSGNITCEVDYNYGSAGLTHAYCQTGAPAQSVTMTVTGSYTTCTGQQCLGNSGINTPTLAYGQATGVGPFVCTSATTGVTCTTAGKGFHISSSGITPA